MRISFSRRTGRIRHIYSEGRLLATLRPTDGLFSLTLEGAKLFRKATPDRLWVEVEEAASEFVAQGRSVFAKHIVDCDVEIRPGEEVIIVDAQGKVLAVGKAILTGNEMKAFEQGVAVRVRRGVNEKKRES